MDVTKKNTMKRYCLSLLGCLLFSLCSFAQSGAAWKEIETGFVRAPDSIQTSVYWYWLSGNISREGVVKDLEAMKKVGINRAFIGNITLSEVADGRVKLFSEEWWDILHTALRTATRLGIEIGIFNSPGWSQSGGPWVRPEQSMRYLASSEMTLKGPVKVNARLGKPGLSFQDVKVIAYPAIGDSGRTIVHHDTTRFKKGQLFTLDLTAEAPTTIRSLVIEPLQQPMLLEGEVQAMVGEVYTTLRHFRIDRSNNALNVGFKPYGTAAISIPATTSGQFRLLFTKVSEGSGIAAVRLSPTPVVEDYIEKTLAKMWQTPFPYWNAYQWPAQPPVDDPATLIDPAKVIDLSSRLSADGVLQWEAPPGNWVIERCGMLPTGVHNSPAPPEGTGLEADKMSRQHIESHFDAFLGEILKRIPAEDRMTWKIVVADSYETGGQNWSDRLIPTFTKNYGYDPTPFLPVLGGKVVGSADQSDRFLWDLRRLVADQVAYEYVGGLRDVCHRNGLTTWLENYGHWGFPGEFLQYGGQSDEVGGEFWSEGALGNIENRAASSCAHIYGKNKVSAESFTCAGAPFSRYPALMKQRGDRFFTEGINNTLLHVYIEQTGDRGPGLQAPFGNEFNRLNTWYYDMDIFLQYIKRCNRMLQQGRYVADVAYFISEDAPKMTGVQDPELPPGYSFDYINAEVISSRLRVEDGRWILPDGMSYRLLVLPKLETMRPELLSKIKSLVEQGAALLGPRPSRSPSLQDYPRADRQVQSLAAALWGAIDGRGVKMHRVGKGLVMDGMNIQEALDSLHVLPDLKIRGSDSALFIHRTLPEGDIYFVSNQKTTSVELTAQFRVAGKAPELWDPVTGHVRDLPSFGQTVATTTLPLELAPLESAFIVFRRTATLGGKVAPAGKASSEENYPAPRRTLVLSGSWTVRFDSAMRGPQGPVIFPLLSDWTQNKDERIKYYSGPALYHQSFVLPKAGKGERVWLDLGALTAIAKVTVNGMEVGGAWTAPYRVDITRALKAGKNELTIKVVNTWVNRLIGDGKLPKGSLAPSGLLGPVALEFIN